METKKLPDSPGWWMREGDGHWALWLATEDSLKSGELLYQFASGMRVKAPAGRWLKVELPTFPARAKAQVRMCWGTARGERRLMAHFYDWGSFTFASRPEVNGGCWFTDDEVTDIVWLTPEYLDEITPAKDSTP